MNFNTFNNFVNLIELLQHIQIVNSRLYFSYIKNYFFQQVCPVDLTRTIAPTTPNTDKNSCRKLAFSVENILDPNKFCSRKENQSNTRLWLNNGFERDERNQMDDDQSESQSGELF